MCLKLSRCWSNLSELGPKHLVLQTLRHALSLMMWVYLSVGMHLSGFGTEKPGSKGYRAEPPWTTLADCCSCLLDLRVAIALSAVGWEQHVNFTTSLKKKKKKIKILTITCQSWKRWRYHKGKLKLQMWKILLNSIRLDIIMLIFFFCSVAI